MTETFEFTTQEDAIDFINDPGAPINRMNFKKVSDEKWVITVSWTETE